MNFPPKHQLAATLLYGRNLILMEAAELRVYGIDFDYNCTRVWKGRWKLPRRHIGPRVK